MTKSMTGFGKAKCETKNKRYTIEIRSLNSKQLDTSLRVPLILKEKEVEIRTAIAKKMTRGKIDLSIDYEAFEEENCMVINKDIFKNYYRQLTTLAEELDIRTGEEILSAITRLPDVMKKERTSLEEEEWKKLSEAISSALENLNEYRSEEGKILEKDIKKRIQLILEKNKKIDALAGCRMEHIRERILKNLAEFTTNDKLDQNRFEQELIYYLEKLDITEEKIRLDQNCQYFLDTLTKEDAAGKKLGFIAQEILREINTTGSKANDADIQTLVIEMKDEIEKVKEQLLNVL